MKIVKIEEKNLYTFSTKSIKLRMNSFKIQEAYKMRNP